jgi:hypothetical protein
VGNDVTIIERAGGFVGAPKPAFASARALMRTWPHFHLLQIETIAQGESRNFSAHSAAEWISCGHSD